MKEEIKEKIKMIRENEYLELQKRPDDVPIVEYRIRHNIQTTDGRTLPEGPLELCEFEDLSGRNYEIPEIQAYVDQGLQYENTRLTKQEKSLLSECIPAGNKMLAFHIKSKLDYQKPRHLRETNIMKWLSCDFREANRLSKAWQSLGLNAVSVQKLVFGYQALDGWKMGLKAAHQTRVDYFENLATQIDIPVEPLEENHELLEYVDSDIANQMRRLIKKGLFKKIDLQEEEVNYDPDFEYLDEFGNIRTKAILDTGFGVHPLHHSGEGCSEEWLQEVFTADIKQIVNITKRMFNQKERTSYGQRTRKRYSWLRSDNTAQAWLAIKDRKRKLVIQMIKKYKSNSDYLDYFRMAKKDRMSSWALRNIHKDDTIGDQEKYELTFTIQQLVKMH